jgi:hypothetical protein
VPLTRKTVLALALLLFALAAGGALYLRHRVNVAVAECDTPAPPEKPATPPPNLPGFAAGDACGPGETAKPAAPAPPGTKR